VCITLLQVRWHFVDSFDVFYSSGNIIIEIVIELAYLLKFPDQICTFLRSYNQSLLFPMSLKAERVLEMSSVSAERQILSTTKQNYQELIDICTAL